MNASFRRMANVDGKITALEEARIPILDRGFLYGDSVYEVFRTYSGVPLFYDEHFERLQNSARLIHMRISQTRDQLTQAIRRTIEESGAAGKQEVYVRYQITRGAGPVDLIPNLAATTTFVIMVKEVPRWNPQFYDRGVTLAVPAVRRNPTNALDPNIKSGNYLNNILALAQANANGADDCLILNREEEVTESSNSNVFFVVDGKLVTPGSGNLRGITKAGIIQACSAQDVQVHETDITVEDVRRSTECFVTSATRDVMPVASVKLQDGQVVEYAAGGGEQTRAVAACYRSYVQQYVAKHAELRMVPE